MQMDGQIYQWEGQITDITQGEKNTKVIVDHLIVVEKQLKKVPGKMLLYVEEESVHGIGHRILFRAKVDSFSLPSNPGEWNQQAYQEARGVFGCCYGPEILEEQYGSFLILDGIRSFRKEIEIIYKTFLTKKQSAVASSMILGEKSSLTQEQKNLYQWGGISHVLAISGLHMSMVGAGFYKIGRKAGLSYGTAFLISLPVIIGYTCLTGMSSSCLRACLMLFVYLFGEWKGFDYDLVSSLCLAALLLLTECPKRLTDSGFLLSFCAVWAAGIGYPLVCSNEKKANKKRGINMYIKDLLGTGLFVTFFSIPVSLFFFYGFSIAGLILNLFVIPVMSVLFFLLFAGGLLCFFFPGLNPGQWLLSAGGCLIDLFDFLCRVSEKIPGAYQTIGYRGMIFAFFYYFLFGLFCIGWIWLRKREKKVSKRLFCLLYPVAGIGIFYILLFATGKRDSFLTMLDVGQGDGILYYSKGGEVCMIDGGSTSKKQIGTFIIKPALSYYGFNHVDCWFISHTDEDHISGLRQLLEEGYPVRQIVFSDSSERTEERLLLEELAKKNRTEISSMKRGEKLTLSEGEFLLLHPAQDNRMTEESLNNQSLVLLLSLPHQEILLTGDVELSGEEKLLSFYSSFSQKKERILKVAHHGSSGSSGEKLLGKYRPHKALISCGKENRYGHPHKETLQRLSAQHTKIYRTDEWGAIELVFKNQTFSYYYGKKEEIKRFRFDNFFFDSL